MKAVFATLLLLLLGALTAAPAGAHVTRSSWTTFEAEQRLTVGKFAATNGVKFANCLGTGAATGPSYNRKFKHFECKLQDKNLDVERQVVVHVRAETTFFLEWLTSKDC